VPFAASRPIEAQLIIAVDVGQADLTRAYNKFWADHADTGLVSNGVLDFDEVIATD